MSWSTARHRLRRPPAAFAAIVVAVSLVAGLTACGPPPPPPPQRLDLRVLVVSNGSLTVEALAAALDAEGVPFTKVSLTDPNRPTIDASFLSDTVASGPRGKFEAVFLPNDNPFGVGSPEMAALASYEATFGVRQVDSFTFPSSNVGLTTAGGYEGSLDGMPAAVTAAGLGGPFGYLNGPVPVDDYDPNVSESYGYLAVPAPAAGQSFTPLVDAPVPNSSARGSLVGVFNDGTREQLVMTIVANPNQTYFRALTHGIVTWATRDVHLGYSRNYFSLHVDDVLAADNAWSMTDNCTPGEPDCAPTVTTPPTEIRMTPDDVTAAVNWQNQTGFKMTMLFNGEESVSRIADNGSDPLTTAYLAAKDQFPWVNHTYSHAHLGCVQDFSVFPWQCVKDANSNIVWVDTATIEAEINNNIAWAQTNGIPFDPTEIVTGEHSGLFFLPQEPIDNPNFITAVNATGLKVLGSDSSRDFDTRPVGNANTSPRYPMSLWYNVDTKAAEVDEYNWLYNSRADGGSGFCEDNPTIATCIPPLDLTTGFDSYIVPTETRFDLMHIITNDPRVHYIHQPNLTGDRLIYPVLDSILAQYHNLFAASAPIVQPTFTDTTNLLLDQQHWKNTAAGAVSAYLLNGQVTIQSTDGNTHQVPVTVPEGTRITNTAGPLFGTPYAGDRSAWITVDAGTPTVLAVPATAPTVVAVNPATIVQGASNASVTIAGTGFATGATVGFSGTGITVGTVTVNSSTQLTAQVSVAANAPAGARDVTVTNPGGLAGSSSGGLTVTATPTVTAVTPDTIGAGATNVAATITGTGFQNGATVAVSGTGVSTGTVTFNGATSLGVALSAAGDAATGARTVTVTNPDGGVGSCSTCLTVGPALAVTSVSPASRGQGAANQTVVVMGAGFDPNFVTAGGTVSFGAGVTVNTLTRTSATQLTAVVTVAGTATVGTRAVTATAGDDRTATLANAFTVNPAPTITLTNPPSLPRDGQAHVFAVGGTGFQGGSVLTISGTGVTIGTAGPFGSTAYFAVVTVAPAAPLGVRSVTITNPDGGAATFANGLTVTT